MKQKLMFAVIAGLVIHAVIANLTAANWEKVYRAKGWDANRSILFLHPGDYCVFDDPASPMPRGRRL